MRHPNLLASCTLAQVATILQPLSAVAQIPLQPAGTLIKLAYQDQQLIGGLIDIFGEGADAINQL